MTSADQDTASDERAWRRWVTKLEATEEPLFYSSKYSIVMVASADMKIADARHYFEPIDHAMSDTSASAFVRIAKLERRVDDLEEGVESISSELYTSLGVTVVKFREMPIEDIKELIKAHVEEHGDFWPDEFADDNELSIMDVFDAIDKLTEEGYLESKKEDDVPRRR